VIIEQADPGEAGHLCGGGIKPSGRADVGSWFVKASMREDMAMVVCIFLAVASGLW